MTGSSVADWSTPGCYHVAPGVHRIPLALPMDGLRAVNIYALEDEGSGNGVSLIDAGWAVDGAVEQLAAGLHVIGRELSDIGDIYVTHIHRDHYTLAPELRRRVGARVHLGAAEAPGLTAIQSLGNNVPTSSLEQLQRAGESELGEHIVRVSAAESWSAHDWEPADDWLEPGPIRIGARAVEAVATPGHTRGHLVFHDLDTRLLFTGDHVLPTITPSIGFELGEWDLPLDHYLASLRLLLERPDARLLPAHGDVALNVHERVEQLLAHHDVRLEQVLTVLAGRTAMTGEEVAAQLTWTRREREYATLDDFNRMIAICETLAHLDLLAAQGRITCTDEAGVDRFDLR